MRGLTVNEGGAQAPRRSTNLSSSMLSPHQRLAETCRGSSWTLGAEHRLALSSGQAAAIDVRRGGMAGWRQRRAAAARGHLILWRGARQLRLTI